MRRTLIACALAMATLPALAQVAPDTARATATRLLDHLDRGEFAQAEAMFDANMKQAVPTEQLAQVWKSLPADGTRGEAFLRTEGDSQILLIPLTRGDTHLNASISIDAQGLVSGLLIRPAPPAPPPPPPVD